MAHLTLDKDPSTLSKMFDRISSKYDRLNQLMTFGIVDLWYKKLVETMRPARPKILLDIATGTATFAIKMLQRLPSICHITGLDISTEMLEIAKTRVRQEGYERDISFVQGEVSHLPFDAETFDAVTCSLGIRNFQDLTAAFTEAYRVLKPCGHFYILELTRPQKRIIRPFYKLYIHKVLPFLGKQFAQDRSAYEYLYKSIESMPLLDELVTLLYRAGFKSVSYRPLTQEIATLFTASK
ncbi:ubiquinone/menaquinone biosynthesis methyltransferase [Bacteroidales bacterium KA00251]|nr:ubiquinone/menaquinone biosynthesis methyltransferase [Bacteroidales bacterium KA00251]